MRLGKTETPSLAVLKAADKSLVQVKEKKKI